MPPLQGYQSQTPRVAQAPETNTPVLTLGAQQLQSLTSTLEQFSSNMMRQQADVTADKARNDALNDSAKGVPFHKEAVYSVYGKAYNNTLSATYAANADIAINKKSAELAIEHENNPVGYSEAMDEYVNGMAKTAPTPELNTVIGISGQKTKNSTFGKLAIAENQRVKIAQVETFKQEFQIGLGQVINLEAQGNMADADILKQKNLEHLGALVTDGLVSAGAAQKLIHEAEFQITNGVAVENMKELLNEPSLDNAQKYLTAETSENRADMSIEQNAKHQADLSRMFNQEIKRRKAADTQQGEFSNQIVGDAIDILKAGKTPDNITEINNALTTASDAKKWDFNNQLNAARVAEKFNYMTMPEQQAELDKRKAQEVISKEDLIVMETLEQNLKERATKAKNDPISLGETEGMYPGTDPLQISNGPIAWADILMERSNQSVSNQNEYGLGSNQLLKETEAAEFSAWLENPNTSIDEKMEFIATLEGSIPGKTMQVYQQLNKKGAPVFAMAGSLIREGKPDTARNILRGLTVMKEFGNITGVTEMKNKMYGELGNAMMYSGQGDRNMMVKSAMALYMQKAESTASLDQGLPSGGEDEVITELTNGVFTHNDQDFFMPKGTDAGDVEDWIDGLSPASFENVSGITPQEAVQVTQEGKIISVGSGRYRVADRHSTVNAPRFLMDKRTNKPLELSY